MLTWCVWCMEQSQFGVGLREAAHNLRICPTTLKRACRRHGIYRWPRRQSWGGGAGDEGRTESMNLDGDVASPAGMLAGSEAQGSAAPTPATGTDCCTPLPPPRRAPSAPAGMSSGSKSWPPVSAAAKLAAGLDCCTPPPPSHSSN